MHVDALRGEAGEERAREEKSGVGRGEGVDTEGGPVVLVPEIVKDLGGKCLVVGGVCGGRSGRIWGRSRIGCGQRDHISGLGRDNFIESDSYSSTVVLWWYVSWYDRNLPVIFNENLLSPLSSIPSGVRSIYNGVRHFACFSAPIIFLSTLCIIHT